MAFKGILSEYDVNTAPQYCMYTQHVHTSYHMSCQNAMSVIVSDRRVMTSGQNVMSEYGLILKKQKYTFASSY